MSTSFRNCEIEQIGNFLIPKFTRRSKEITIGYPLDKCNISECWPIKLSLQPGVFQFELWGARGAELNQGISGLGAYTSGVLFLNRALTLFVYIGATGFYNSIKGRMMTSSGPNGSGGSTDVRLEASDNWYDEKSLVTRIMVASGGGSAEGIPAFGGNGGTLQGESSSFLTNICPGANQTSSSQCDPITIPDGTFAPVSGAFGYVVDPDKPDNTYDGGWGGNGYYSGASYPGAFGGSGGSSFISGHPECKAIKRPNDGDSTIVHTNDSIHYSGIFFNYTHMIAGNQTMPRPNGPDDIWNEEHGAFRLTKLFYVPFTCLQQRTNRGFILFVSVMVPLFK